MKKILFFVVIVITTCFSFNIIAQNKNKILKIEKDSDKLNITIKDKEHFNALKNLSDDYIETKYKNVDGIKDIKLKRNTSDEIFIKLDKKNSKFLLESYFNVDPAEIIANKDL